MNSDQTTWKRRRIALWCGQTDRLLTVEEVAEWLGVPVGTIYAWRYRSCGPASYKVGRHVRFRRADVEAWLEDQRTEPREPVSLRLLRARPVRNGARARVPGRTSGGAARRSTETAWRGRSALPGARGANPRPHPLILSGRGRGWGWRSGVGGEGRR